MLLATFLWFLCSKEGQMVNERRVLETQPDTLLGTCQNF